jgi:elongation factor 1-gamma
LIVGKYIGIDIDYPTDFNFADTRSAEFLQHCPMHQVPALVLDDGNMLFETQAICKYVAGLRPDFNLLGGNYYEQGRVESWLFWGACALEAHFNAWDVRCRGIYEWNETLVKDSKAQTADDLAILNSWLADKTYLVGDRITLADLALANTIQRIFTMYYDAAARAAIPHVTRWWCTLASHPAFTAVCGALTLCDKPALPQKKFPAKAADSKKGGDKKAEKKPEKKAEKKPEKKEAKAADEEEAAPKEPKKPDPMGHLPPSSMVLDEWKRCYSNNDTRPVALPWLANNFDKEGWSFWKCDYKYNDELAKVFMTCNLIGGFFQRCDHLRKYAFGSVIITGAEPKLEVSGVWMFRGKDMLPMMMEVDDAVCYDWKKLDWEADRELIFDYFAWDGKLGGKSFNQGKIFK